MKYYLEAYVSYDKGYTSDPREFSSLYLGYLVHRHVSLDDGPELIELEYCSGSDYSGDAVTRSNYEVVLAEMKERGVLEKGVWSTYGGYSSYGVVYAPDLLDEETLERIHDIERALEQYPVLDDDKWSEVESEAQDEAWSCWLDYDVATRLRILFKIEDLDEFDPELDLRSFFEFCMEKQNEYYENEQGNSTYVNIERVLPTKEVVLGHWIKWKEQEAKYEQTSH